ARAVRRRGGDWRMRIVVSMEGKPRQIDRTVRSRPMRAALSLVKNKTVRYGQKMSTTSETSVLEPGKSELRRRAILDVAREAFLAQGFAATSMSEIATRLG